MANKSLKTNRASKEHLPFSYHIHNYLTQHVWVADAKCGFVSVLVLGLLVAIDQTYSEYRFNIYALWIAVSFLSASLLVCLLAVFPTWNAAGKGYVFPTDLSAWKSHKEYYSNFIDLDQNKMVFELAGENYYMGKVLHRKYALIRIAIWFLLIGVVLLLLSRLIA